MLNGEKFYIVITVDTNDADYNTAINIITKSKLDRIMPLIDKIKNFKPYRTSLSPPLDPYGGVPMTKITHDHNYPYNCSRTDLGEKTIKELYDVNEKIIAEFEDLLPYCEYDFHSIESIKIIPYIEAIDLIKEKRLRT